MGVEIGSIVKDINITEPVIISQIRLMGSMVSLKYTGINTNKANSKVISEEEFDKLNVLTSEGSFNFQVRKK